MAKVTLRNVYTHKKSDDTSDVLLLKDMLNKFNDDFTKKYSPDSIIHESGHFLEEYDYYSRDHYYKDIRELKGESISYDAKGNPVSGTINEVSYRDSNLHGLPKHGGYNQYDYISVSEIEQDFSALQTAGITETLFAGDDEITLIDGIFGGAPSKESEAMVLTGTGNDVVNLEVKIGGPAYFAPSYFSKSSTAYFNVGTQSGDDTINAAAISRPGTDIILKTGEGNDKIILSSENNHAFIIKPTRLEHASTIQIKDFDPKFDVLELPMASLFEKNSVEWGLADNNGEAMIVAWTRDIDEYVPSSTGGAFFTKIELQGISTKSVSFSAEGGTVEVSVNGSDLGQPVLLSEPDLQSIQAKDILGTTGDDILVGGWKDDVLSGNGGDDFITGLAGNDTILGGVGDDFLLGGDGDDTIHGVQGADTIYGGKGNDILTGFGDNSQIYGSFGQDILIGGGLNTKLNGGYGDDQLYGSETAETLIGDSGNDALHGYQGDDTLEGGSGHDGLFGGGGADKVSGGSGNDYIEGNDGADQIEGGYGNDTLLGNSGNDVIQGNAGSDNIAGGDGNDILVGETLESPEFDYSRLGKNDIIDGGAGDDVLDGGVGKNTLFGGEGNDLIFAGLGNEGDVLFGGAGNDKIHGGNGDDYIVAGPGTDVVSSGDGADLLKLEADGGFIFWSDFENGTDRIDATFIKQGNETASFRDLVKIASTQDGTGTWIGFSDTQLILESVSVDQIDEEDFFLPEEDAA